MLTTIYFKSIISIIANFNGKEHVSIDAKYLQKRRKHYRQYTQRAYPMRNPTKQTKTQFQARKVMEQT